MIKKINVRDIVLDVLLQHEQRHIFVNLTLKNDQKFNSLKAIDKGFGYRLIYGVIQNKSLLDYQINNYLKNDSQKVKPVVRSILRIAAYQIIFMDKVPARAACNEAVEQTRRRGLPRLASFVNAIVRKLSKLTYETVNLPERSKDVEKYLSVKYSHPIWIVKKWINDWGLITTEKMLAANNNVSPMSIRINPTKTNIDDVINNYKDKNIEVSKGEIEPNLALKVTGGKDISSSELFKNGLITIQDEGAVHAVTQMQLEDNIRVLDMCSAPGGKTALISNLMNNTGEVVAVDIFKHRLKLLKETCDRLGVTNVTTHLSDATKLKYRDIGTFDRILLDAPCTGLGTLRTKPEIRWYREKRDIYTAARLQEQLLFTAVSLIKPNGIIVYSTCSIEKEETSHITRKCAKLNLISEKHLLPHKYSTEGFYVAVLQKK
ncbi:16S rRNA (cytosine(967)-C(5))-methyltransferase RsmB [Clostridium sp. 'deep sea']|uniref:16S rRNA (cytosine(967)-C(5))-methyltransferase RsmB n=1 Tax=Clostridium sp. 'deep sea' TaxID=2779445 RepID=UPI0018964E6E|nr:16S rRNA (cytosine(967)-C(5))-methyltransferase RsmB [Clostridium sp. 'deep sea']QOR36189.1 16S rRNA (cytosine(967)-C(5))-methyltransferase RsmB [Clostridium sp. 'deep sea']